MATKKAAKSDEPNFEQDLERLESIVSALEEGGLSLDDSLKKFEEGIGLAKRCEKTLTAAEKKIELLTKNADGELVTENYRDDEEGDSESEGDAKSGESSGGLLF
jgi:exodeoxyribonuclease VII small subunit